MKKEHNKALKSLHKDRKIQPMKDEPQTFYSGEISMNSFNLTKEEMMEKIREGFKITHRWFSKSEWMTFNGYYFVFEDGVACTPEEFFRFRDDESWDTGWSVVE